MSYTSSSKRYKHKSYFISEAQNPNSPGTIWFTSITRRFSLSAHKPLGVSHGNSCPCCLVLLRVQRGFGICRSQVSMSKTRSRNSRARTRNGPSWFCSAARQWSPLCRAGMHRACLFLNWSPPQPPARPTSGTLARSYHKLLADFSHVVMCQFVNWKCK